MEIALFILYLIGVAVQYVRLNTVHAEWKENYQAECRHSYDIDLLTPLAVAGSWFAFAVMTIKVFLDKKFINKTK
jgi:hypothetical protein